MRCSSGNSSAVYHSSRRASPSPRRPRCYTGIIRERLVYRASPCLLVAALFLALTACGRPEDGLPPGTVTVRDSADIRIVENHAPAWDPARFWTVDPEPEIAVGGNRASQAADDPAHLLWRLKGAALLSDGRVAVLTGGEPWVLVFDTTGALAAEFGRKGQGPGEFSYPLHLQVLPGDTIVVWDRMWGPIGHFDPSGMLLRDRTLDLGAVFAAAQTPANRLDEQSSEWSVFDPEGRWLGTMSLPIARVTWITTDRIVGVLTDPDLGVESVVVHRLNRTAPR